ncbi:MAG: DUF4962 domain-containing protein [Armatimonadetes bacterium]|nr:DUF4962 domain-containing protein [Armatimonadota bacterium]
MTGLLPLLLTQGALVAADFEAPPAAFQTSARPADGETLTANPPCFVYPASRVYPGYVVEYGPARDFARERTRVLTSRWMLAVPAEPLAAGAWHWHWRPGTVDDGGTVWSEARSFTVPDGVPVVPLPDIAAVVRKLGRSHPRVVVTLPELDEYRRTALQRYGQGWLDGVRKYAEQMQREPLLPEPEMLPETRDLRRIELYQKTFQTTRPFFSGMYRLAQDYLLTGNELSGQEARRRLLHIMAWDPRGSTSLGHNDEPATELVRYPPLVYDWIYPLLTPAERRQVLDCLAVRLREMMGIWERRPFEMYPYESHNMGYYLPDMLGACLALAGDAPVEDYLAYTLTQLWSPFYPPYGGEDGGWNEGPPYWGWSVGVFMWAYRLVETATGVPISQRSNVRNQAWYKLYGNPPWFQMSPFGDGQEGGAGSPETMWMLAGMYRNPYAKWYAEQRNVSLGGLPGLLYRAADDVPARPPLDIPQGRAFFDVGLACMHSVLADRTADVALLFRSCPFGSISHAYQDQNTFALDAYGQPLIIASGYYQLYGHPHHDQWTRQTKASNSVLVNGEGQARSWDAKGRLTRFDTTVAADYAVGDASAGYGGKLTRFDRQVVYLRPMFTGGETVIVIRDSLAAPQPSTYQFLLHALDRMEVDEAAQQVTIAHGQARCRVDYLAPRGLKFAQTDQFPVAPFRESPNQWHLTASTVEPAVEAQSLIVIQPYRRDARQPGICSLQPAEGGVALRISGDEQIITVLYRTDPAAAMVRSGNLRTDAEVACFCEHERHSGVAIFGGTTLTRGDSVVVRLPGKGSYSGSATPLEGGVFEAALPAPGIVEVAALRDERARTEDGKPLVTRPGEPGGIVLTAARQLVELGARAAAMAEPVVDVEGQASRRLRRTDYPRTQRSELTAEAEVPAGTYSLTLRASARSWPCAASLALGAARARAVFAPDQPAELAIPAASLAGVAAIRLGIDHGSGGDLAVSSLVLRRVFGVNLLPNGSFEELAGGAPEGWTAGSITNNASCSIESAPGGRTGERCVKVTCTRAGGDYGVYLNWPGVPPADVARKFRLSCWVKSGADAEAAIQVTSREWTFWKNTPRLRNRAEWHESSAEFELPPGTDLTHLRLHLHADQVGAELFVDDASLVELP